MTDHTHDDELETIRTIMRRAHVATVTTRSVEGMLASRPLAVLDHDFDGTVWFFTAAPSPKTDDLAFDGHVNVAYVDGSSAVSLAGIGSVSRDAAMIDAFWNPFAEAWFEGGRDDPAVALLKVDASSVEYWHVDKPAVVRAVAVIASLVTGSTPDVGESRTLEF